MKKLFAFLMLAGMFTACTVKTTESTTVATEDTTVVVDTVAVDTVAVDTTVVDSIAE